MVKTKLNILYRILVVLAALGLSVYAIHCWLNMQQYIGTDHYWWNPWFFKAHACLIGIIILDGLAVVLFGSEK